MDPPAAAEVETKSEKADVMERAKSHECGLCDTEVVYKIAQELLPGLASACVDNTTGGIFKSAGSVAVDMRKEMVDYLTQRSETYVAEFLLSENATGLELSEHPYDIIINLIDDFAASKRNMFSRVSEWVLSDRREDRIDDFVQEMEINGFWLLARRECVASVLLKNVDYKNAFHCNMACSSEEEIVKHRSECKFRPMDCTNEGCTTRYCAAQKEHHEAVCPFMILPCEQKCSDFVMRREMDRHCVTICPMKLVNCAFYTVGCKSSIPRCNVQQHNTDDLSSHLLYIMRTAYKEANEDDLKHRVEKIRSLSNIEKLGRARDARALTYLIKDPEAKLGPLEVKTKPQTESPGHEDINKKESPTKTEPVVKDGSDSPNRKEEHTGSEPANEIRSSTEKPAITKEGEETKLSTKEVQQPQSPKKSADSPVKMEENKDKEHEHSESPMEKEVFKAVQEEESNKLAPEEKEQRGSPIKETLQKPSQNVEKQTTRSPKGENVREETSNTVREASIKSPKKETNREESSSDEEESKRPFEEEKNKQLSSSDEEDTNKSATKETVKESVISDEEESTKSIKRETVEESSHQEEKTYESSASDEEELMKSPSEIFVS